MGRAKEIIPGLLWMSSHPDKWRPRSSKVEWLVANVRHVVLLANRPDPELEVGIAGVHYWHFPVVDSHIDVDPRISLEVVPQVINWIRDNEPVLVSCLVGRSRSGMTCALVAKEYFNLSGADALTYLREKRPLAIKRDRPAQWLAALP
jgi:protein-tyrosine phosphatase